jgi:chromosome segregation ATPase
LKIANENITKLENELHTLSDQLYRNKNDLNELNKNTAKEKAQADADAKTKIKMEEDIKEKEIEIENLTKENKEIQIKIEDINKDQPDLTNEVETYRDHILVLSEQNELLSKELEAILERDIQLKTILKRTDKLCMTCDENRRIIENSLNNLRAYLDKTECNYKNSKMTPMNKQKYNYNRRNGYDKKKQMYEY